MGEQIRPYTYYNVQAGEHIDTAILHAIQLARTSDNFVSFNFNGVDLIVQENDLQADVRKRFEDEQKRQQQEYQKTDAYAEKVKQQKERADTTQNKVNTMLNQLGLITTEAELVSWIGDFSAINDHVDVDIAPQFIIEHLETLGYERNDCVNHPDVRHDSTVFARWLIGQALDCLHRGMPVHPVAQKFSEDYQQF